MLTELLIASLCASQPTLHQGACTHAVTATTMQAGFKQDFDMAENKTTVYVTEHVAAVTGATVLAVGGAAVKGIHDKSLNYRINTRKWDLLSIDYINTGVSYKPGNDSGSLGVGWRF